eukprot:47252-Prymnesium_polylepis.1
MQRGSKCRREAHLDRLGLARAGGALGRAAEHEVDGAHQRAVAAVGERRDDEARRVAEVLHVERQLGVQHVHVHRLVLLGPVVAQLREPLEVDRRYDAALAHLHRHVALVHIDRHERAGDRAVERAHRVGAQHDHDRVQLLVELQLVLRERCRRRLARKARLDLARPHHLRAGDRHLPGPPADPVDALLAAVLEQRRRELGAQRLAHRLLDVGEPSLDVALLVALVRVDPVDKVDALALERVHRRDHHLALEGIARVGLVLLVEGERRDALEALGQVRLHRERVLRLREDLEQLVVREEEEAREGEPLEVEVVVEALLDLLEEAVGVAQLLPQLGR